MAVMDHMSEEIKFIDVLLMSTHILLVLFCPDSAETDVW